MDKRNKTQILRALSEKKASTWKHKLYKKFKSIDWYGSHIHFTYKGKSSYKTSLGALFTLITRTLVLFVICYESYLLYTKKFPLNFAREYLMDLNGDAQDFTTLGFDLAFNSNLALPPSSIGSFAFEKVLRTTNNSLSETSRNQMRV